MTAVTMGITKLDEPVTGLYNEAIGEGETGPATPGSRRPSTTMTYTKEACPTDAQDDPEARELLRRGFLRTGLMPAGFNGVLKSLTRTVDCTAVTPLTTRQAAHE